MARRINTSPAVITREIDLSIVPQLAAQSGAAFIGLAEKGPAFIPIEIGDFGDFRVKFGGLNQHMYMPYAVRSHMVDADYARVVRVLGKGNPDNGYAVDLGKPFVLTFTNQGSSTILSPTGTQVVTSVAPYSNSAVSLYTNAIYDLSFTIAGSSTGVTWSLIRNSDNNALQADGSFVSTTASNSAMPYSAAPIRFKTEGRFETDGITLKPNDTGADAYTLLIKTATTTVTASNILITSFERGEALAVLRSRRDDADSYDLIQDVSITGSPFDFDLQVKWHDNSTETLYNMSLDRNAKQYLSKFIGTNPEQPGFGDSVTGLYVDAILDYKLIDSTLSQVFQASSYTGSTSGIWTGTQSDYNGYRYVVGGYQTGHTATVVSQPYFANGSFVSHRLFTIYSRSDGEASNKDVKVSITNVQTEPDDPKASPKFDVIVRTYDDIDRRLVVLEQYRCDMNPDSDNYIARVIGDRTQVVTIPSPGAVPEIEFPGEFSSRSNYVRVVVHDGYPSDARPAGFLGPAGINPDIPEERETGAGYEIDMPYKTDNILEGTGQKSEVVFLGFDLEGSNTIAVDKRLKGSFSAVEGAKPAKGFMITATPSESIKFVLDAYVDYLNAGEYVNSFNQATPWVPASGTTVWSVTDTGTLTVDATTYDMIGYTVASASSTAGVSAVVGSYNAATNAQVAFIGDPSTYPDALFVSNTLFTQYLSGYNSLLKYYVVVDITESTPTIIEGAYQFTLPFYGGHDGISPYKSLLGAINDGTLSAEFISALNTLANPDEIDINLLFIPGVHSGAARTNGQITLRAIEMCEDRTDCFYVMDIGKATSDENRERVTTGALDTSYTEAINAVAGYDTSYAAVYFPWLRIMDPEDNRLVWVPASVEMAGVYALSDRLSYPWFAPAGTTRGLVRATEARRRPAITSRDILYDGRVNPIATITGQGIITLGQKTLQKLNTALTRVNVRRLLIYLRKTISSLALHTLFENNTPRLQQALVAAIDPILMNVRMRQGIIDYRIKIDEQTNTPDIVDRNILYGKIAIKPARSIEWVILDFILTPTGGNFDEVLQGAELNLNS